MAYGGECVPRHVAALAWLGPARSQERDATSAAEVRAVIAVAAAFDPAGGLTLPMAAIAGADRAEYAGSWWDAVRVAEQIQ